jgi:hypothetical protein
VFQEMHPKFGCTHHLQLASLPQSQVEPVDSTLLVLPSYRNL